MADFYVYFLWEELFFQPLVEPAEEFTLPQQRVLRLQYPVVFIGYGRRTMG